MSELPLFHLLHPDSAATAHPPVPRRRRPSRRPVWGSRGRSRFSLPGTRSVLAAGGSVRFWLCFLDKCGWLISHRPSDALLLPDRTGNETLIGLRGHLCGFSAQDKSSGYLWLVDRLWLALLGLCSSYVSVHLFSSSVDVLPVFHRGESLSSLRLSQV